MVGAERFPFITEVLLCAFRRMTQTLCPQALFNAAHALDQLGRREDMARVYRHAMDTLRESSPKDSLRAQEKYADISQQLAHQEFQALRCVTLLKAPSNDDTLGCRYEQAIAHFQQAVLFIDHARLPQVLLNLATAQANEPSHSHGLLTGLLHCSSTSDNSTTRCSRLWLRTKRARRTPPSCSYSTKSATWP